MSGGYVVLATGVIALFILTELIVAVLPVIVVVALVPPDERHGLAEVLAAADSRRRLRLWRALRAAVKARRAVLTDQPR
jgi:putative exporter of polyketide antibiotics